MQLLFIDHTEPEYSAQCLAEAHALLTDPVVEIPYRYAERVALIDQTTGPFHHVWLSGVPEEEEDHFKVYLDEPVMLIRVTHHGQPPAPQRYSDFCWLFQTHNPDHFGSRLADWLRLSTIVWEPAELAYKFPLHSLPTIIVGEHGLSPTLTPRKLTVTLVAEEPMYPSIYHDNGDATFMVADNQKSKASCMRWLAEMLRGYCPYDH